MSTTRVMAGRAAESGAVGPRRVRHQARDVAVLMAFSAGASVGLAVVLLAVATLAQRG